MVRHPGTSRQWEIITIARTEGEIVALEPSRTWKSEGRLSNVIVATEVYSHC